jgi:hypothetical protein
MNIAEVSAAHAVMVGGEIIRRDHGAAGDLAARSSATTTEPLAITAWAEISPLD